MFTSYYEEQTFKISEKEQLDKILTLFHQNKETLFKNYVQKLRSEQKLCFVFY